MQTLENKTISPGILLTLLLVLYLVKQIFFLGAIPLWQGADEYAHFALAQEFGLTGKYPRVGESLVTLEVTDSVIASGFQKIVRGGPAPPLKPGPYLDDRSRRYGFSDQVNWQAQQHPLYYILAGSLYWMMKSLDLPEQVYILRILSVLLGLATVLAAARAVRLLFPDDEFVLVSVPVLVVSLPAFSYLSAVVTNDSLTTFLAMLLFVDLIRFWKETEPRFTTAVRLGFVFGLGLLTRLNFAVLAPMVGLVFLFRLIKELRTGRALPVLRGALTTVVIGGVVGGAWLLRNKLVLGNFRGGWAWLTDAGPAPGIETTFLEFLLNRGPLAGYPYLVFTTFWVGFGWGLFQVGPIVQGLYLKLSAAAFVGVIIFVVFRRWKKQAAPHTSGLLAALLIGTLVAIFVTAYQVYLGSLAEGRMGAAWGRYYFPVLFPILLMLAVGVRQFVPAVLYRWVLFLFVVSMVALDVFVVLGLVPNFFAWGFSPRW